MQPQDSNYRRNLYLGTDDDPNDYQGGHLLHNLLLFGRLCHAIGLEVTPNRMLEVARSLEHLDLTQKRDFYYTLRAYLVNTPKEFEIFDLAFNEFWKPPSEGWIPVPIRALFQKKPDVDVNKFLPALQQNDADNNSDDSELDEQLMVVNATYSNVESLRRKDFAQMSQDELEAAQRIMSRMPDSLGLRRTRRFSRGKGQQLDMRRMLREQLRNGGDWIQLPTRAPKEKPRPVILICDISGSMERYTRVLLHFAHTLASSKFQVESFVFSTHLQRITRQVRQKSVDDALAQLGDIVKQWGGGTKTGQALKEFNFQWSRRVLGRGAIVMLITDGWDRGDIALLDAEAARLGRFAKRFIWLNPLLDAPTYEPLTRGAQAILPHVDDFLAVRNLANLEIIFKKLQQLNSPSTARPFQQKYLFANEIDES